MDTVILFHQDLANFSTRDLQTLARYYDLAAPVDDLRWMIAIKHAEQKAQMVPEQLTNDPYLNIEIIKHLNDESLDSICTTRKDLAWSCEEVWKERAHALNPEVSLAARQTWRQAYEHLRTLKRLQEWLSGLGKKYSLKDLTDLQELDISEKQLTEIPRELGQLANLQNLDLGYNQLTEVPRELGQLTNLQKFDLAYNQLTEVPTELGQLTNLRDLDLEGSELTEVPTELSQLGNLQILNLAENQLIKIPAELGQLGNLQELYLAKNQLTDVPRELAQLGNLQKLYLAENQLTDVPRELGQLINLRELGFRRNQLTKLPTELGQLTNLRNLYLEGNPLGEKLARNFLRSREIRKALAMIKGSK